MFNQAGQRRLCELLLGESSLSNLDVLTALREVRIHELVHPNSLHHHILGFTQLRVGSLGAREVRINHWPADTDYSEEPHTHLWDLDSYILLGALENTLHGVEVAPLGDRELFTVINQGVDGTTRSPTGVRVSAGAVERMTFAQGTSYSLDCGQFHTAKPVGRETMTLLLTSAPRVESPLIVSTRMSPRSGIAPMIPVTGREQDSFEAALARALRP